MMNITKLELRNSHKTTLSWGRSIATIIVIILTFFPSMQNDSMKALTNAKLESINPAILSALGINQMPDFTVITTYFGYVLQFITLAFMVYVTHQAANLFIKEESEGTIEFLYAKPVSREDVLLQKALAHFINVFILIILYAIVTLLSYLVFSDYTFKQSFEEISILYGGILLISFIFSSIGLLASTLVKNMRSTSGLTIGIVFGTFILGAISAVVKELDFLIYLSPMDWIKTEKLMSEGIRPGEWLVAIIVITVCCTWAFIQYRKKDLLL